MTVDTVEAANQTPEQPQPFRELGLTEEEYQRIKDLLGRRPTDSELGMYSVMWSEHCSYKSSKVHLQYFGETTTEQMRTGLLAGIGANAGVVDIGHGWAVTFKAESHNHPSFIEPYQGAATGVGGIVRDILAMGARPVAVMDQLCFGAADAPDTRRVLPGVVAGVGGYGNCLGLPNIGGQTLFDDCYTGNPLVNALCLGVLRADAVHEAKASGVGNLVVLYGARTGRDGIGGVSVLASETFEGESAGGGKKLPAVQVGDPFMEKLLIESSLEIFAAGLVEGIQDLGGAGLSCAISELAAAGDGGMRVTLDKVPLRAADMTPAETLCSESQERMCAIVSPENLAAFLAICARWEVTATVIGEVTDTGRLQVDWHGERIVDVVARTLADEGPVYRRPVERPAFQDALAADTSAGLRRPVGGPQLRETLLALVASPGLCSKRFITEQYDSLVRGNSVLIPGADAGLVRVDEESGLGVAIATDANGRFTKLDPYRGAQLALAEAYRNVAVTGAAPRAVTNCLNFGSPQDPGVMWQFSQAVRGLADGCATLGIPVTGGNVSFYNQTADVPIHPTPVVGVLGVLEDVASAVRVGFAPDHGQVLFQLGATRDELDGSAWAQVCHGHLGGQPPEVDLEAERRLAEVLQAATRQGLVNGAHDLSEGGLAQALVESVLAVGVGARVILPEAADPFVSLFAESPGRALVAVTHTQAGAFESLVASRGVPVLRVGVVVPGSAELEVQGLFTVGLDELRSAHEGTLPALFA
ncbi:phosphoribosylformylglycinamidine synthase II [Segniliparus rotundus DSM 44985]|uniref:Phosphoribosylformylglycinamidine synthase subunit PurL n=1 Tax=Segniliparus rotundus (strain ATCC BAA-972 / CDC 1076 / CIP 108378 / DSM 44985 / JCM 13578) TaxID=640132 RepID=D6ZBN9_SEGRD|nr:phosphoribosylformylglycinamidine synthase subunit PurL [Segniliparus rotundus]ADG98991.1 phosphoribosylformylglycinamidine synthase II [Segniliparus rotundus DSM 44985]